MEAGFAVALLMALTAAPEPAPDAPPRVTPDEMTPTTSSREGEEDQHAGEPELSKVQQAPERPPSSYRRAPEAEPEGPPKVTLDETVPEPEPPASGSSWQEYRRRRVWFKEVTTYDLQALQPFRREHVAVRGDSAELLGGAEFYEAIGRPDLASTFRETQRRKTLFAAAGLTLFVGGFMTAVIAGSTREDCSKYAQTQTRKFQPCADGYDQQTWAAVYGGGAFAALGALSWIVSLTFDPHEGRDATYQVAMARAHEARLRRELSLPEISAITVGPRGVAVSARF